MNYLRILFAATIFTACARHPAIAPAPLIPTDFDHVVVAVSDFGQGVASLRAATGVELDTAWTAAAGSGGADIGGGASVAMLSLGQGRYLELVGPASSQRAAAGLAALFAPYRTATPIGWAVHTNNVDSIAGALGARGLRPGAPRPGSRERRSSKPFAYRALQGWDGVTTLMPFFVQWVPAGESPASTLHPGCELGSLTLDYYTPDSLATRIGRAGVRVTVRYGEASAQGIRLTLKCPAGLVQLPARAP